MLLIKRLETDSSIKLLISLILKNLKNNLSKCAQQSSRPIFFSAKLSQVEMFAEILKSIENNSCVFTPASVIWLLWKIICVFLFDSKIRGWLNYCRKSSVWHFRDSIATVFNSWHLHYMKLFRALLLGFKEGVIWSHDVM